MTTEEIVQVGIAEGYTNLKSLPDKGICGLYRFAFTVGLVIGIDDWGYYGRYCYHTKKEAQDALESWNGVGDPSGEWIKYKGTGGERSRIVDLYEN